MHNDENKMIVGDTSKRSIERSGVEKENLAGIVNCFSICEELVHTAELQVGTGEVGEPTIIKTQFLSFRSIHLVTCGTGRVGNR